MLLSKAKQCLSGFGACFDVSNVIRISHNEYTAYSGFTERDRCYLTACTMIP